MPVGDRRSAVARRPAWRRDARRREPSGGPGLGRASAQSALPRSPRCAGRCLTHGRAGQRSAVARHPALREMRQEESHPDGWSLRRRGPPGRCADQRSIPFRASLFHGQTPCERMAPAGVRWGAAGSREAASRRKAAKVRAGRTSHGLVATFPRAKPIFPASGHETAPRPSAGEGTRSAGAQRRRRAAPCLRRRGWAGCSPPAEAGKSRFLFSWALRCERHRRALPHQPVSRSAGSNQPEVCVSNTYAGLCLDGSWP